MIFCSCGMYRSGSTWLYNAVRLLVGDCYGTFVHKASDYDKGNEKEIHLIKCHKYLEWIKQDATFIVSIYRPLSEVKQSMERRALVATKGFTNETRTDLFDIYHHNAMLWILEADHVVSYECMIKDPVTELRLLLNSMYAKNLPVKSYTDKQLEEIAEQLRNMKVPESGHDPVTLLHENHITKKDW